MSMLGRQTMSETSDAILNSRDHTRPLCQFEALAKPVYSKVAQEDLEGEASNVSPRRRGELSELRRRLTSGVGDCPGSSGDSRRGGETAARAAMSGPDCGHQTTSDSAKSIDLDDVLDALRRASVEPIEAHPKNLAQWPARSGRGDDIFAAEKPTKFDCYTASFAVEPFAFVSLGTGRAVAVGGGFMVASDSTPRDRGNELIVATNRLPVEIVPLQTGWEGGRGNVWRMLCSWFNRLLAPGAYATFRQNLIGDGLAPLTLALRSRIGKASPPEWRQSLQLTHMRALLPRPHAGGAIRQER